MREPIVIIGAGAAGLAVARELGRLRVPYRLLERGHTVGQTWHDLYDSLRLHTGRHLSALPGMRMSRGTPLFPSRLDYHGYLRAYAQRFGIVAELGREVTAARMTDSGGWEVVADGETIGASGIVVASGIVANPFIPQFTGRESFRGVVLHSVDYSRPDTFAGMRVLVIGVGNSGGEIGSELARAGVDVTVAVRSGANVVPLTLGGIPIQYLATLVRKLPRRAQERIVELIRIAGEKRRGPPVLPRPDRNPLDAIPLIGFHLVDEIRAGRVRVRPGVSQFTSSGVRFTDGAEESFDAVILATGFRPAISFLDERVQRDARGFALRTDRVTSADVPGLVFVGHNYDARGGLLNIAADAPAAARRVVQQAGGRSG